MSTLKKIGLTALAGSMVAISANAGEMAVNGYAKATYTDRDTLITGSPFGLNRALEFSGSGDLDNGNTVSVYFANNGNAQESSSLSIGMGDMGTIKLDMGTGGNGIGSIDDKTPTAAEELWDNIAYGAGHDGYRVGNPSSGALVYKNTFGGVSVNADYVNQGGAANDDGASLTGGAKSSYSVALTMSPKDGLNVGLGHGKKGASNVSNDYDQKTAFVSYAAGPVTVGYQVAAENQSKDLETNWTTTQWGASFAVNENLSLSYGERTVNLSTFDATDEDGSGIAASYTMGAMAVSANMNKASNYKGSSTAERKTTEIAVSFSF
jgi:outer membrane protein OmpU